MKKITQLPPKLIWGLGTVLLIALVWTGLTRIAADSWAGHLLYPIKRADETIRLAVSVTPKSRAMTHLRIADSKMDELDHFYGYGGSGLNYTLVANQLREEILGAENNMMVYRVKGGSLAVLKEELCERLEGYEPKLNKIVTKAPADAKDPVQNLQQSVSEGIDKAMAW